MSIREYINNVDKSNTGYNVRCNDLRVDGTLNVTGTQVVVKRSNPICRFHFIEDNVNLYQNCIFERIGSIVYASFAIINHELQNSPCQLEIKDIPAEFLPVLGREQIIPIYGITVNNNPQFDPYYQGVVGPTGIIINPFTAVVGTFVGFQVWVGFCSYML